MFDENYINIARSILGEIGLGLNSQHLVYDQDTGTMITIEGKPITFTFIPNTNFFYDTSNCILFDPFNDFKTMNKLFSYYLDKEQKNGNMGFVETYYIDEDSNKQTRIVIKTRDELYESEFYKNKCLKICDIILKIGYPMEYLSGEFDLRKFDE